MTSIHQEYNILKNEVSIHFLDFLDFSGSLQKLKSLKNHFFKRKIN